MTDFVPKRKKEKKKKIKINSYHINICDELIFHSVFWCVFVCGALHATTQPSNSGERTVGRYDLYVVFG